MADDSMDIDNFETAENEAVTGGGGYIDDIVDVDDDDDDDDDEPILASRERALAASAAQTKPPISSNTPRARKRGRPPPAPGPTPEPPKVRRPEDPLPNDLQLRAAGYGATREFVVAKFRSGSLPSLQSAPHVRMYREEERTLDGRKAGLEAHEKQKKYFQSFSGQRRLMRYSSSGIKSIPDRNRKGWKLDVAPPDVAKRLVEERKKQIGKRLKAPVVTEEEHKQDDDNDDEGEGQTADPPDNETISELKKQVRSYSGSFEGKSTSRYAIMVMDRSKLAVDVIPVDEYAWFSFRAEQTPVAPGAEKGGGELAETVKEAKTEKRFSKFQLKYDEAQLKHEQGLGDNTRIAASSEAAQIGLFRGAVKMEEKTGEIEFEREFDDDDDAQIDKETEAKPARRVEGDPDENLKLLRSLIKDEDVPASPGSDSDEDATSQQDGSSSSQQSPSPEQGGPPPPNAAANPGAKPPSGVPTGNQSNPASVAPAGTSQKASPKSTIPPEISNLLPPPGTPPTVEHVRAVLEVLLRGKTRINFKDAIRCFERKTKDQKKHLTAVLKQIAMVTSDESKNFYISWRKT